MRKLLVEVDGDERSMALSVVSPWTVTSYLGQLVRGRRKIAQLVIDVWYKSIEIPARVKCIILIKDGYLA